MSLNSVKAFGTAETSRFAKLLLLHAWYLAAIFHRMTKTNREANMFMVFLVLSFGSLCLARQLDGIQYSMIG
jgi:hypothetical protein